MIDIEQLTLINLAASFLFGAILGVIYFGSLWLTLRYLASNRWSTLLYVLSLAARMTMLGVAIYLVLSISSLKHVVAMLIGLVIVRVWLLNKLGFSRTGSFDDNGKGKLS